MNKLIWLWLPVLGWAGLIYFFSSLPGLSSGLECDTILRKSAHIVEYFILTFLLYRAFKGTGVLDSLGLLFYPTVLTFLYAISDEIHQLFVPNRLGAVGDVWIDVLGVIAFYVFRANKEKILNIFFRKNTK
jgi:VanZ family protein